MLLRLLVLCLLPAAAFGFGKDPFQVTANLETNRAALEVRVRLGVPPGHFLYADELKVTSSNAALAVVDLPAPIEELDKFTGERKRVYTAPAELLYRVNGAAPSEIHVRVAYQGCDEEQCFFPQKKDFRLVAGEVAVSVEVPTIGKTPEKSSNDWKARLASYREPRTAAGYLSAGEFLKFLGLAERAKSATAEPPRRGLAFTLLLLAVGGVALNLTPCVLPLIPINLAILGAGAQARTKAQGFLLGGAYGMGMAVAYGVLGALVVATGAKFGALNASVGFNVSIAVLFVLLALGMFGAITIDFSRWQGRASARGKVGIARYTAAFAMGTVAALLAGACVAPVLISTLLMASQFYSEGIRSAALMPFLLGAGMALPWPFAGAGLSFLPKPGRWMTVVKHIFGVFILGLAAYYGKLAWDIHKHRADAEMGGVDPAVASLQELDAALASGRPVFVDFWATWCKNCTAMEATTFKNPQVVKALSDFQVVRFQAEVPDQEPALGVLDHFGAIGLPTYVILEPGRGGN